MGGLAAGLLWMLFAEVFLTHNGGRISRGGFPAADREELAEFLASLGFVPYLAPASRANGPEQECFRGSYHGSGPFLVSITIEGTNAYGVHVDTAYDYHGLRWNVADSSRKAQEFGKRLNDWMEERFLRRVHARQ